MAPTYLLVGAGKMGGALLSGWLKSALIQAENLAILDPHPGLEALAAIKDGATALIQAQDIPPSITHVVLAIKPQLLDPVAVKLAPYLPKKAILLSILAGTSLKQLEDIFGARTLIRAMPNTPAAIGAGISAVYKAPKIKAEDLNWADQVLQAGGAVVHVESEAELNAVTAVSGSGPAYIFYLVEALEKAAKDIGLPQNIAAKLARQTVIGSAQLLDKSDDTPSKLRQNVTSPNGTTQAALDELMDETSGLSPLMNRTVKAALRRAEELSQ